MMFKSVARGTWSGLRGNEPASTFDLAAFLTVSRKRGDANKMVRSRAKSRNLWTRMRAWMQTLQQPLRLGARGERAAEKYLKRHGYRIVTRNFRASGAEIDLVAMDGETLVFVEVKTRRSLAAGTPEEAVDMRKQSRLRRAGEAFASRYGAGERTMRFDIVAVNAAGPRFGIEILRNAF
jgi:putative endonuclease